MAKGEKNFNTCKVFLDKQERKALLTVLTYFIEADDSSARFLGNYANAIREKILTYSMPFAKNGEQKFRVTFSETESALLIKYFAMFALPFINDDDTTETAPIESNSERVWG